MTEPNLALRLRVVAIAVSVTLLYGCAGPLTEDEKIAAEYARVERKEAIREYVAGCEAAGYTIFYTGPTTQKLRDPVKRIPNHAQLADYQCVNQTGVSSFVRQGP